MTSHIDTTLRDMIQTTLDTFFLSLRDSTELNSFLEVWTNLHGLIQTNQDKLQEETLIMVHNFSSVVNTVATSMIELQDESDRLCRETLADIDQEMENLSISTQPKRSSSAAIPAYIKPSYEWLLSNLHNPYPSKEIRDKISYQTASGRKEVDDWFIDVRKRIGWNKLRLKHYSNKRSKIVDAATRFFKGTLQKLHHGSYTTHISGIDSSANHDLEFRSVEKRAKELYSDKLFETSLATKTDGVVEDLGPEAKLRVQVEEHLRQVAKSRSLEHLFAYPSPEHSPERSPEPSPNSSFPMLDATQTTSRKRRNSGRDSPELDVEERRNEPQKRSRLDSYQISRDLAVASLPSPAASLSDITRDSSVTPSDQDSSENECFGFPTPPIPAAPSGKRKRRLSDAGHVGPSKRPHNALAVPRLQTVSDPLPLANPIYKTVFGQPISDTIPGPVSVESLDDTQVEVDFYNYDTALDTMQSFSLADFSLGPYLSAPSLISTANSEPLSLDKSQNFDPSLDFLFENFLNTPPQATDIPFFADIPAHDHSTLFPFENMFLTQLPQEDILSDPFHIPGLWDFQGNDDSFPTIVPSIGTLFSGNPVSPQIDSTQNEKEAKRKQIEALRAQLQSLEAEL